MKGITEVVFYFVFSFTMKEESKTGLKKERRPIANRQLLYQSSLLPHFLPHGATVTPLLHYLKDKSSEARKFLRVISHRDWVTDQQTLLKLYRILTRLKIDIYAAARKSSLKSLNTVHHERLRLILGAFRTSTEESIYCEAYEPRLQIYENRPTVLQ